MYKQDRGTAKPDSSRTTEPGLLSAAEKIRGLRGHELWEEEMQNIFPPLQSPRMAGEIRSSSRAQPELPTGMSG